MESFYFQRVHFGKSRRQGHRDVRQANETDPVAFLRKWPSKAMKDESNHPANFAGNPHICREYSEKMKEKKSRTNNGALSLMYDILDDFIVHKLHKFTYFWFTYGKSLRIQVEVLAEGNDFVVGSTGWRIVLTFRKILLKKAMLQPWKILCKFHLWKWILGLKSISAFWTKKCVLTSVIKNIVKVGTHELEFSCWEKRKFYTV